MQVISFMNMKGGVGKTTLAVNIAFGLAELHQKKVLIVDCDPQFNASQYLLSDDAYLKHIDDESKGTLRDVFMPRTAPVRTTSGTAKVAGRARFGLAECSIRVYSHYSKAGILDLIPSILPLVEVQHSRRQTERRLKTWLDEKAKHYDYVLIDCPPTISIFTEAAILASSKYLVPIKPDPLSVVGLPLLERYIEEFTQDVGMKIEQVGIVFTQVRAPVPNAMRSVISDLRKSRGAAVFKEQLSTATSVAESVAAHQPILKFRRSSNKVTLQITDITAEFLKRTGG
jgi:chromosome partitioning protein